MKKEPYKLSGHLETIGELEVVKRPHNVDIVKRMLTIKTTDEQVLFAELRNNRLNLLDQENISEGDYVELQYIFQGSEKGDKKFNNINISNIINLVNVEN